MAERGSIWLIVNEKSGSNTPAALAELEDCCGRHELALAHRVTFPDDDLPDPATLDAKGVGLLALYAGDGTVNSVVTRLYGWGGSILVLPGGTMNLLFRRLHGDVSLEEVIARVAARATRRVRPQIVRTAHGDALAELLAGPGTAWYAVREAMREADVIEMAESAGEAIAETTEGSMLRCREPAVGQPGGYPLIDLTPGQWGLQIDAYHADSPGDYLRQGWALLRRRFREGPHDRLGIVDRLEVADTQGKPVDMLIDGEPASGAPVEAFEIATCEVDLLASANGG